MAGGATRVLLTGFGAFPNAPDNPTARLVRALSKAAPAFVRNGVELHACVLPVAFGASAALAAAIQRTRPAILLHFGLAGRRRAITVETRAANRGGILHPDATGHPAPALRLVSGAPASRPVRFPVRATVTAIRRAGLPCRASIDAGDYICNETLFRSLATTIPVIGFIHVPRVRGPAATRGGRLTAADLETVARLAIGRAVRYERAISSTASA